jgi:hypothetical protein
VVVAEVQARHLGSPLDSFLELTDWQGRRLAFSDDEVDKGAGLMTHHADSRLAAKLPAAGTYTVRIRDTQGHGGVEHAYRLRIGDERPDFALRIVPSTVNARAGMSVPLTVYVLRRDGFAADVELYLKDAPPGFSLSGGRVPAGLDMMRFTLAVPQRASPRPLELRLEAQAVIRGQVVQRPVVAAEDMMQAFAYRHLVPGQALQVVVAGNARAGPGLQLTSDSSVKLPIGRKTWLHIAGPKVQNLATLSLELDDPPPGLSIVKVTPQAKGGIDIQVSCQAKPDQVGVRGNLLINVILQQSAPARGGRPANRRRLPVGVLPAIPFEIVAGGS